MDIAGLGSPIGRAALGAVVTVGYSASMPLI